MQADRRRYIRFDVPLDVTFKPASDERPYSSGSIRNFSRDGCCIESEGLGKTWGEDLELKIRHPLRDIFITAKSSIVWKRHIDGKWLAGISILDMDKEAKSEILDFAYAIWLEKNMRQSAL